MGKKKRLMVGLFIDGENCFKACKRRHANGLFFPHLLAVEICQNHLLTDDDYDLVVAPGGCRVYTGMPTPHQDAKASRRKQRRLELYRAFGVQPITRPLKRKLYSCPRCGSKNQRVCNSCGGNDQPVCPDCGATESEYHEKGVDVHLAVEVLSMVIRGGFDVVIVASGDSDFVPLYEHLDDLQDKGKIPTDLEVANLVFRNNTGYRTKRIVVGSNMFKRIEDNLDYGEDQLGNSKPLADLIVEHCRHIESLATNYPNIYGCYKGFKYDNRNRINNAPNHWMVDHLNGK